MRGQGTQYSSRTAGQPQILATRAHSPAGHMVCRPSRPRAPTLGSGRRLCSCCETLGGLPSWGVGCRDWAVAHEQVCVAAKLARAGAEVCLVVVDMVVAAWPFCHSTMRLARLRHGHQQASSCRLLAVQGIRLSHSLPACGMCWLLLLVPLVSTP